MAVMDRTGRARAGDLQPTMRGQVIDPSHAEYEILRRVHNGIIDKRPVLIARCIDAGDVIAAVNFGRAEGSTSPCAVAATTAPVREPWTTRATFPDLHVRIEALVAQGDLVATREVWSGTHVRTGEQIQGTVLHFFRVDGGPVVEEWSGGWERLADQEIISARQ